MTRQSNISTVEKCIICFGRKATRCFTMFVWVAHKFELIYGGIPIFSLLVYLLKMNCMVLVLQGTERTYKVDYIYLCLERKKLHFAIQLGYLSSWLFLSQIKLVAKREISKLYSLLLKKRPLFVATCGCL